MDKQKSEKQYSIHTDDPFDILAIRAKMIFHKNVTGLIPTVIKYKGVVVSKEN